jgi:hypothetical protein|tara:strand:- start:71 stop:1051 length:981 start_codon:yes stop_codon:yes gene_type:complete
MKNALNLLAALLMPIGMAFATAAENYDPPKTAFGVPDVQGIWTYETRTSLQRPEIYEGALEIDEDTMLAKMISTEEYNKFLAETGAEGPTGGAVGAYNDFWFAPGNSLATMNGMYRTSLIIDPADGQIPWKQGGQEIRQAQRDSLLMGRDRSDGPEGRALADRCLVSYASTMPFVSSFYNNNMQIVQSPTHVMLLAEMVHNVRVVRIDQDFRDLPFEQWLGDSIGYYEEDTLVVVTRDFNPWQVKEYLISENVQLTERFSRVAADRIHYSFTIDDPELYSQPWTAEMPMAILSEQMYEYACHEGNYSLPSILAGARREEMDESEGQ